MKKLYLLITIVLFVLIALKYFPYRKTPSIPLQLPIVNNPEEQTTVEQFIKEIPDTSQLKAGGSSYLDSKGRYLFLYPSTYKIDSSNNDQYTRLYYRGSTQEGQTEIYDGVLVVFESIDLENKSLEEFTNSRIKELTPEGGTTLASGPTPVILNTYPGFTYELQGFGSSSHLIIQKDKTSNFATEITFSVNDPENKNYLSDVYGMLSTVELLK